MKKKLLIIGGVIVDAFVIPSGIVLAVVGIDNFQAYLRALEYGLLGLAEYFDFILDLFKKAIG